MDFREVLDLFRVIENPRDVIRLEHIPAHIALFDLERAERAVRRADVREVDMAVHRIIDRPPARPLLRPPRTIGEEQEVVVLIKRQRVVNGKAAAFGGLFARGCDLLLIIRCFSPMTFYKLRNVSPHARPPLEGAVSEADWGSSWELETSKHAKCC